MSEYSARFAGSWYPGTKDELNQLFKGYFNNAHLPSSLDKVTGIIAPHAGYAYSGQTAAFAFKALKDTKFDLAVVLAPSHRAYLDRISTFSFDSIKTPLGTVEVERRISEALSGKSSLFGDYPQSYMNEHSFELELPFLQYVVGNREVKVLPLIVGDLTLEQFESAAEILKEVLKGRDYIIVASSDFTHYGENFSYVPFKDDIEENLEQLDMGAIRLIEANNIKGFYEYIEGTDATICGKNPILLLMSILKRRGTLLNYTSSGAMTGDFSHTVSYASIAI